MENERSGRKMVEAWQSKALEDQRLAHEAGYVRGAIVYLKSGSPPLSVYSVRLDGHVDVEWFSGSELKRDAFPLASLTLEEKS